MQIKVQTQYTTKLIRQRIWETHYSKARIKLTHLRQIAMKASTKTLET